jgi:poly-beta-hydroxybutyrate-responsive repressor
LLRLAVKTRSHGYELIEDVGQFESEGADPGAVYRNLRAMESEGLVTSEWDTDGSGPAKRLYSLTPEGVEMLRSWVVVIRQQKNALEQFLSDYAMYEASIVPTPSDEAGGSESP